VLIRNVGFTPRKAAFWRAHAYLIGDTQKNAI